MAVNNGAVEVIGTLVPMNKGKYPVVRACDVGLSNGSSLEEFLQANMEPDTFTGGGDIVRDFEVFEKPFSEINDNNVIRIRLRKNGKQVFCSIYASLELPENGVHNFDFKIPEAFAPIHSVFMPFISIKNERERGVGQYIISPSGIINIFSSSDEDAERCSSNTWLVR